MKNTNILLILSAFILVSCGQGNSRKDKRDSSDNSNMVRLITVDPGHFHAALVQKTQYQNVSPDVYVFAPSGPDLQQHLERIESYNNRAEDQTKWNEIVFTGDNFFEKMIGDVPGNVVVLSGNNRKKTDYILRSVKAGLNVLADKPMVISADGFRELEEAFRVAGEKGVLLYDLMTERYEISTILQKELSQKEELFGRMMQGSEDDPAVSKISVHHFSKIVSGSPLIRPAWFFDTEQQGEGIVDVTTHLVDLIQWECFPGQILKKEDVNMVSAKRWPTIIKKEEFRGVTGLEEYPDYLLKYVRDGNLNVYANGEMVYKLKGVWAKVSVVWNYQAPPEGGDTHFSVLRGDKCDLVIRQTEAEKFIPTLYIENIKGVSADGFMPLAEKTLASLGYDGLAAEIISEKVIRINIPVKYRIGHEAHFAQVTEKYLGYLEDGKLPEWEVPNMIVKYFTTTSALTMAKGE